MTTDELLHDALTRAADGAVLPAVDLDAVRTLRRNRARVRRTAGVVAVLAVLAVAAAIVLPSSPTSIGRITTLVDPPTAKAVSVTCTGSGITVTPDHVRTTPSGVVLYVDNRGAAGTYLGLEWSGGGQGDPMTAGTSTRTVPAPPGRLTLMCADAPGSSATVDVVDADSYWSSTTLAAAGCPLGSEPSWAVGPGTGPTAQAALDDLEQQLLRGTQHGPITWEPARIGYRDAPTTTWIASYDGQTRYTAIVTVTGSTWTAEPDIVCA